MWLLYNILINIYGHAIKLAGLWNSRARKLRLGRKEQGFPAPKGKSMRLWLHASSVGEFEQGIPFLEEFCIRYPDWEIIVSHYSPSAFEFKKEDSIYADRYYLPLDTQSKAEKFVSTVEADLAVFVKYDIWPNMLRALSERGVPIVLMASTASTLGNYFRWPLRSFFGGVLTRIDLILLQNDSDLIELRGKVPTTMRVGGDTRYDRVLSLLNEKIKNDFTPGPNPLLIAGSLWPEDYKVLMAALVLEAASWDVLILPHDPDHWKPDESETVVSSLDEISFDLKPSTYTLMQKGILSRLYRFADVAYVGGGFTKGIHSILEPAVYGIPVIFGPKHEAFAEAEGLIESSAGKSIKDYRELNSILKDLQREELRKKMGREAKNFVNSRAEAARESLRHIRELILNESVN